MPDAVVSFVRKPTPAPVPVPGAAPLPVATRAPTPAPVLKKPTTGRLTPVPRRPSAEFDAVEADFFARESEIFERPDFENYEDSDGKRR
jgi:hypothetical protein